MHGMHALRKLMELTGQACRVLAQLLLSNNSDWTFLLQSSTFYPA